MADDFPQAIETGPYDSGDGARPSSKALARRADFALGAAIVRPSVRTVEGPAGGVTAEPRVMQVMLALADADGSVLTRKDLLQCCWNGVIVGDDSINRAIAEARRVAREAEAGFTIETIPRVGYRLTVDPAGDAAAPAANHAAGESRPSRRGLILGGTGAAVAALGGGMWWLLRDPPTDPKTLNLVSESEQALRLGTPKDDSRAIGLLEVAVQRRPEEASLWGKLALARARAQEHAAPADPAGGLAAVEGAARRALTLEPRNADAHAAMAILIPYYGDWLAAERRFNAVLAIDPRHAATRDARAFFLNAAGRTREGSLDRVDVSRDHPLDAGMQFRLVYAYWMLDRIGDADRAADRAMDLWPRHSGVWLARLWIYACTGRLDRALAHIEDRSIRPTLPPPFIAAISTTVVAEMNGAAADRADAINRIMASVAATPAAVVSGMMLLHILKAVDESFALADAYFLERGPILAAMRWRPGQTIVHDQRRRKTNMLFVPAAEAMQSDPRFAPLMEAMGLADYWRQRRVVPDHLQAAN